MSDDVTRAVGGKDPEPVKIAGKECFVRGLSIRELGEVERECLKQYKRKYLETFSDNYDLLPPDVDKFALMKEKMEEAAKWDVDDLPLRYAYDPDSLRTNGKLEDWAAKNVDFKTVDEKEKPLESTLLKVRLQRVIAAALDREMLDPKEYTKMTGHTPVKMKIGYANWWITAVYDGMIELIYACFKNQGVTKDQVFDELQKNPTLMVTLSRDIEKLSAPKAGNG